jgi:hypothetical protein
MKWTFVIQQKLKAAVLLATIMATVLVSNLLTNNTMKNMGNSFSSIYQDRLIPARDIVYLTENLYMKRLILEKYLLSDNDVNPASIISALGVHNHIIDTLITAYEKTYLVDQESKSLISFKQQVKEYSQLENAVVKSISQGDSVTGKAIFEGNGAETFQQTINHLNDLIQIQSTVGQELLKESRIGVGQFVLISTIQIVIALGVGLMVLGLIQSSRIVNRPQRGEATKPGNPFNLN